MPWRLILTPDEGLNFTTQSFENLEKAFIQAGFEKTGTPWGFNLGMTTFSGKLHIHALLKVYEESIEMQVDVTRLGLPWMFQKPFILVVRPILTLWWFAKIGISLEEAGFDNQKLLS